MSMRTLIVILASLAIRSLPSQAQDLRGEVRVRGEPLANAVVFLVPAADSAAAVAPVRARLDQRGLSFVPRVLVVTPGSIVEFPNSDPVMHNVFHPGEPGTGFDLGTYSSSEEKTHRFDAPGLFVLLCHVHPEMVGYVAVVPSALHAVTGEDGAFQVTSAPPGQYQLHAWHRRIEDPSIRVTVPESGTAAPVVVNASRRSSRRKLP